MRAARAVVEAARRLGRRVPEDLAVVSRGFARDHVGYFPTFTGIEPDQEALAVRALGLLQQRLGVTERIPPRTELVPARLVPRESTVGSAAETTDREPAPRDETSDAGRSV